MFAHVAIRASDWLESERFYRTVLGTVGIEPSHAQAALIAWDDFAIFQADAEIGRAHV